MVYYFPGNKCIFILNIVLDVTLNQVALPQFYSSLDSHTLSKTWNILSKPIPYSHSIAVAFIHSLVCRV